MSLTRTHKAVVRVSPEVASRRQIIVIVGPGALLGFRLKGTRKVYETTVGACYSMAVKAHVARARALKLANRKGGRK